MSTVTEFEASAAAPTAGLGIDLARVSGIAESIRLFGRRFTDRCFTSRELDYALSGIGLCAERLAARFAAKEAVIKALSWSEAGVNLRDIEVAKQDDGSCTIVLHGGARRLAEARGIRQFRVCLSHDGDCAAAVVQALTDTNIPAEP